MRSRYFPGIAILHFLTKPILHEQKTCFSLALWASLFSTEQERILKKTFEEDVFYIDMSRHRHWIKIQDCQKRRWWFNFGSPLQLVDAVKIWDCCTSFSVWYMSIVCQDVRAGYYLLMKQMIYWRSYSEGLQPWSKHGYPFLPAVVVISLKYSFSSPWS